MSAPYSQTNNRRIAKNTIFLYIRMLLLMLIALYTSRVVLSILGVNDFGIYNVVGGVVVLFSFLNSAMVSSIQRFLNFELGRGEKEKASRIFSMSINCQLIIIVLVVFFSETIGLWFLNTQLNIPENRMYAANWVYQFSIITMCISVFYSPYNAAIIAYEKMSIYAFISIFEAALKLGLVYILLLINYDNLILYSFLMLMSSMIVTCIYISTCIRKFDICRYQFFWEKSLFQRLISFSGWSLFGGIANIGASQGINIILNMFFGVTVNAAMGIAGQVNATVNKFLSSFTTAYNPQIVKAYASNNDQYFTVLINKTSRFSYYLLLLIGLPVIINCPEILDLWLEEVPGNAAEFCQLMIVYTLIESISIPLWMSIQAVGRIKKYQISIFIIKLSILPISAIGLFCGLQPVFVMYVKVFDSAICHIYRLLFLKKNIDFNILDYSKKSMCPCLIVTLLSCPIPILLRLNFNGLVWLISIVVITIATTLFNIYTFGLEKNEKAKLKKNTLGKFKKK